ncbi:MAG: phosphoenolpyruvate synthase [Candidatus Thiodiazotropha lotti]|nr:phosphoenolpyruvate synthase [Candidatus Thiodiazotropha lotti]MCW4196529.1 phosphoenolpyruvate synthase [Candidatus Thiodiazotropha lotti]MCW4201079.1 phosphoenolpyruvate synthase [Candidatus Thiodiazotropha lotti]MCW4207826.1 phosphoenolpyruvate synthase [Candidatus Thiodiazotropha lotti]MCW4216886.1 phosphoenolpyruvate synthase [Candidatus Thiodiazotropha lotti]
MNEQIIWFENLKMHDVDQVGGKNASLGEMISGLADAGVSVPGGFATTAHAYREFLRHNRLAERIDPLLQQLDVSDVTALAEAGKTVREWVVEAEFPEELENAVTAAYKKLVGDAAEVPSVAVRSSATAEDLPDASFAGQQETFLNVEGLDDVLIAIKEVFASLYNDRAISYRVHQGFAHEDVALSAGIQRMVRSDVGSAGVMFTLDTESGFKDAVFITSSYGLGETVVQGAVNPDEFYVHKGNVEAGRPAILRRNLGSKAIKMVYGQEGEERVKTVDVAPQDQTNFSLTSEQIESLAQMAITIEKHYQRPMDIEWGLDGTDGQLYILQARPETVESRVDTASVERFKLEQSGGKVLAQGRAIGQRIGSGVAKVIADASEMAKVEAGDVLVTDMTDPDWEPVMKKASAIVTNRGGRTCHAAIIARELGIPAVVGCHDATEKLQEGQEVTVSCAEGDDGFIYEGLLKYSVTQGDVTSLPEAPAKIMMNVANPSRAFAFSRIPNGGIGLARLEFIINTTIGVHPRALMEFDKLPEDIKAAAQSQMNGYDDPVEFYVEKLVEGISTLAAAFEGKPVIVRMSDFKSNEYANLIGGKLYEPSEENPMIGFRGASRYISESFRPCFELECRALKRVREEMGFSNVEIMIPFVRTLDEAAGVISLLEQNELKRGENDLRVIMMCELPSNAVLAEEFLEYFDGFSIGSNDMTQLTLGLDRDSGLVANSFDERNPAVKRMLSMAIQACNKAGKYVGICGQGPSDYPDLAEWLVEQKITSVSLNPDTVVDTWRLLTGLSD